MVYLTSVFLLLETTLIPMKLIVEHPAKEKTHDGPPAKKKIRIEPKNIELSE